MAAKREKRSFGSIRRLPSGRYQVRFTGPDGSYVTAHRTFAARQDADSRDEETAARLASLSEREREVMQRVAAGKLNKVIAAELEIAMRTVEVHRARVFEKMGVRSAVELAQLLARQ